MNYNPDKTKTYKRLFALSKSTDYTVTRSLRIGLIVPPSPFVVPGGWEFVHSAPFEGPSVIAAVLKGLGFEVILFDQREQFNPDELAEGPLKNIDIVGIATYEDSFPFIKRVIEIAKEEDNKRPVIIGGPLVTSVPQLIMDNTLADYAVIGEGELTTIELMDYLLKTEESLTLNEIHGLAWKNADGQTVINTPRQQMYNLDAVPLQDLSVWPRVKTSGEAPEIYMTSSRGCPFACSFCFRTMPLLRYKSAARVRSELLHLKKYKYRFAWWSDLTFIDEKERIHTLMDEAFGKVDFRWSCFTRVDGIDLSVLTHMKDKGCDIVMYGFESITKEVLDYFRKKVLKSQIINAIKLTKKAGLKVGGLFIIGGSGETRESLNRTIAFCEEFKEVTRVKYLSAIPGTPLYFDAIKKGIIKNELDHLYFLSRERSVEEDEILNFTELEENELRDAYHRINYQIEIRPYEYWNPVNYYLRKPKKFKMRPSIIAH